MVLLLCTVIKHHISSDRYAAKGLTVADCQPVGNTFFYRLTQKGNFGTARDFCTRAGGDLATINNEAEFNAFAKVMHSIPMADKLPSLLWGWVWIGMIIERYAKFML